MPNNDSLRVLHVIPSLLQGGAERLCLEMNKEMQSIEGVTSMIAVLHDQHGFKEEYPTVQPIHVDAHVIPSITGKWDVDLKAWNTLISDFKPHIVHSHLFEAEMVSRHAIISGVRYFTHCHQNTPQLRPFNWSDLLDKARIGQLYEREHLFDRYKEANNQFICISNDTKKFHSNVVPRQLNRNLHLLPNAIDVHRFFRSNALPPEPTKALRLVNTGRLDTNKNQQFLIRVVKALVDAGINTELVLIGEGPDRGQLERLINELNLEHQVRLLGNINNIEEVLWRQHIYVHSAISEGFGLALIEAMAAGLPVVTLDGLGNRELIQEGINGHMISTQNIPDFVDRVQSVAQDDLNYIQMSKAARTFAQQFDIHEYCNRLVHLYQTV